MSFKTLQNALFQMSGSRAMPLRSSPTVISNSASSFTATYDGWLYWIVSASAQAAYISLKINGQNNQLPFDPDIGGNRTMLVPIKKGDTSTFDKSSLSSIADEYRCLFKLVGGGLIAFCRKLFGMCEEVCYVC